MTRLMRVALTATVFGLTPLPALCASQAEAENAFAAGMPLQNVPDVSHPLVVRDGSLVCESASTFVNNEDVMAVGGDAKALGALNSGCVNWHAARLVRVRDPRSDQRRYVLAMRFGVLEFSVLPESESDAGDAAIGFIRAVNLLDRQPSKSYVPMFDVQIGPDCDADAARSLSVEVTQHGFKPTVVPSGSRFAVRVGPYSSRADALKALERAQVNGWTAALISPD